MPASSRLHTKQAVDWRKSRRWEAMLILATTAYTGLLYFLANLKTLFMTSLSMSISRTILSQSAKISSPFSSISCTIASITGRLEMEATTSPPSLNTASHIPMPSGTVTT